MTPAPIDREKLPELITELRERTFSRWESWAQDVMEYEDELATQAADAIESLLTQLSEDEKLLERVKFETERKAEWQPIETAPRDGTEIWAYLYDSGVRLVRWCSEEEAAEVNGGVPDEYEAVWCEVGDWDETWSPRWWLPKNKLPLPPKGSADGQ